MADYSFQIVERTYEDGEEMNREGLFHSPATGGEKSSSLYSRPPVLSFTTRLSSHLLTRHRLPSDEEFDNADEIEKGICMKQIVAPDELKRLSSSGKEENLPGTECNLSSEHNEKTVHNAVKKNNPMSDNLKAMVKKSLENHLMFLMKHEQASPFFSQLEEKKDPYYFKMIKNPINFSTMRKKFSEDKYTDPWEYVNDLWQIFWNAALHQCNRRFMYRQFEQLSQLANQRMDHIMEKLGFCCGQNRIFSRKGLPCHAKYECVIPTDVEYYSYQEKSVCQKCFNGAGRKGGTIKLMNDNAQEITMDKSLFELKWNDKMVLEPFVSCKKCGRAWHAICAMHIDEIHTEGFTCDTCLAHEGKTKQVNPFSVKDLPRTFLSDFIENGVNKRLQTENTEIKHVSIRVVASVNKCTKIGPLMSKRYASEIAEGYPYQAKGLFAFQEIEGMEVCIFGMYVQEYGSSCPGPNKRSIYVSYLDSVHFFRPRHLRTTMYQEIVIGYLKFVKDLGYDTAYLWSCPPLVGQDFLFHCHPPEQKMPDRQHLQKWYQNLFDKAISAGVVKEYQTLWKYLKQIGITSPAEIPYFDGDIFQTSLEEILKKYEDKEIKHEEAALANTHMMESVQPREVPLKRGRGRPPKNTNIAVPLQPDLMVEVEQKRGRGRPRKNTNIAVPPQPALMVEVNKTQETERPEKHDKSVVPPQPDLMVEVIQKRGRGRPRKNTNIAVPPQPDLMVEVIQKRGRGRPRKNTNVVAPPQPTLVVEVNKTQETGRPKKYDKSLVPPRPDLMVEVNKTQETGRPKKYDKSVVPPRPDLMVEVNKTQETGRPKKYDKSVVPPRPDLMVEINNFFKVHGNEVFRIVMNHPSAPDLRKSTNDPDQPISNEIMDTRFGFLNFVEQNRFEFSTLRHAKFSTMAVVHQLFLQKNGRTCNGCRKLYMDNRNVSKDPNLCVKCYYKEEDHQNKTRDISPMDGVIDTSKPNRACSSPPASNNVMTSLMDSLDDFFLQ